MPEPSVSAAPPAIDEQRSRRWLVALVTLAIVVRIAVRLAGGEEAYLRDGYTLYLGLADNLLQGHGLCYAPGQWCAIRMPLYPLFVAAFKWAGLAYPGVAIAQAVMGGATVWATWWIGRALFSSTVATLAAAAAAVNPYSVVHDTALQDTALVNLLTIAAVALLIKAARTPGRVPWLAGGMALALAILTSARVALFVPCALGWMLATSRGQWRHRLRLVVLVALPVTLLSSVWLGRNVAAVGAPVFTSEAGAALFKGNSSLTFTHFPDESIDLVADEFGTLPLDVQQRLDALDGQELATDRAMGDLALAYIAADPGRAVRGALRKLWVVASAQLSPAREPLVQWGYRLIFLPVHLLALAGAWRARGGWRDHALLLVLVLSFAATTAVYWAHTSHKSLIDPVLFVYAAAGGLALTRGLRAR